MVPKGGKGASGKKITILDEDGCSWGGVVV